MKREKRNIYIIDIIELIISLTGIIAFTVMFALVNTIQRIMFAIAALYFAFNTYEILKEALEIRKSEKIIKYSKKEITGKEKRKLSY